MPAAVEGAAPVPGSAATTGLVSEIPPGLADDVALDSATKVAVGMTVDAGIDAGAEDTSRPVDAVLPDGWLLVPATAQVSVARHSASVSRRDGHGRVGTGQGTSSLPSARAWRVELDGRWSGRWRVARNSSALPSRSRRYATGDRPVCRSSDSPPVLGF
jgi:hypothetical protein